MRPSAERVIQQLVVDNQFEEAVKSFSKDAVVQSLKTSVEYARSNYHKRRGDRLARSGKRPDKEEGWLKQEIAVIEKRLAETSAKKDWSAEAAFSDKVLNKWKGGALSGLLFDRGRSTIARHLFWVEKIDDLLKTYTAVPIDVDDNGEGSYSGWAFRVYYSLDDWLAAYGDGWLSSKRDIKPWQWLAGVVAWDRPDFKLTRDPFTQVCEPGWHWLALDDERQIDGKPWRNVKALLRK